MNIDPLVFHRLQAIGLVPAIAQHCLSLSAADTRHVDAELLRITEVQRDALMLHDGLAARAGRALPALLQLLRHEADALAVGDWVLAAHNAYNECWVHERLPPLNQLARRLHDGRDKVERVVIVSNVDTALVVMGLDHDFSLRRVERYIALVRMAGVQPLVVLTKADVCAQAGGDVDARLQAVQALLPPGAAALALNALGDEPQQRLGPWLLRGHTLVLLGSSGAGKSTLTNALLGTPTQATGANRADDSRGRHTTTVRSLHPLPGGACLIDTPGLRTLRLDGDAEALGLVYDDITRLALQCRFRDCQHHDEPGCAVREGVPPERLRNYQKLQREARRDTQTALERKAQVQLWKARARGAKVRTAAKRG